MRQFQIGIALVLILLGCTKEDFNKREYPRVFTDKILSISENGTVVQGTITLSQPATILDHGFIWTQYSNASLDLFNQLSLGSRSDGGTFQGELNFALGKQRSYIVKAYVKTEDFTVYGNELVFESQGGQLPIINDFNPKAGLGGDTISITGKNFSAVKNETQVFFGTKEARIIDFTLTTIVCIVPFGITEPSVKITVATVGNLSLPSGDFQFKKPTISNFFPTQGTFGEKITIIGSGFSPAIKDNVVYFGTIPVPILSVDSIKIEVNVPDSLNNFKVPVSVVTFSQKVLATDSFFLKAPVINRFTPKEIYTGDLLELFGNYYSPIVFYNSVVIGDAKIPVFQCCVQDYAAIVLPDKNFGGRNFKVGLERAGQVTYSSETIKIKGFVQKENLPIQNDHLIGFSINDKGYMGLGINNLDFWQYDPSKDRWKTIAKFKGAARYDPFHFVMNGKAYVGGGISNYMERIPFKDFWSYDPVTDNWQALVPLPVEIPTPSASFVINNKGYIFIPGNPMVIWEYDPIINQWTKKDELLLNYAFQFSALAFAMNDKAYIYVNAEPPPNRLYIYSPSTGTFKEQPISDWLVRDIYSSFTCTIDSTAYIYDKGNGVLIKYDSRDDTWSGSLLRNASNTINTRTDITGFSLNGMIYFGGGKSTFGNFPDYPNFWEYEPE